MENVEGPSTVSRLAAVESRAIESAGPFSNPTLRRDLRHRLAERQQKAEIQLVLCRPKANDNQKKHSKAAVNHASRIGAQRRAYHGACNARSNDAARPHAARQALDGHRASTTRLDHHQKKVRRKKQRLGA